MILAVPNVGLIFNLWGPRYGFKSQVHVLGTFNGLSLMKSLDG